MRFAIVGVGGVGAPFGAALADAGNDVTFIARGDHLKAMQEEGLRILGEQPRHIYPVQATGDAASVGPVDFILFAVKLGAVESAAALLPPMLGPDTAVVSLQNGVDTETRLSKLIGPDHVMGGVAEIFASIEAPGEIRQVSPFSRVRFGELDNRETDRAKALLAAFENAGIEAELSQDIERTIWLKFLILVALSGMTAATRVTVGQVREDSEARAMLRAAIEEAAAVGIAKGVNLSDQDVDASMARIDVAPAHGRASMAVDLERGNPMELPWLSGVVVSMGRDVGVPTPVHGFINTILKFHQDGRQTSG